MVVSRYSDGTKSVHNVGINGSGGVALFALRPGIHAVDIPSMKHIGEKANGSSKINSRRADQRWFLIEYPVDMDYNQEAYQHKTKDIREHLPTDGWYSFQTNSGAEARQHWFITGAMKIVGAVSEQDVRAYARDHGFEEDLPWLNGKSYDETSAIDLKEYMRTTTAEPTPSKTEMRQRILDERKTAAQDGQRVQYMSRDQYDNIVVDMDVPAGRVKATLKYILDVRHKSDPYTFPVLQHTPQVILDYCHVSGDRSFVMHSSKAYEVMTEHNLDENDVYEAIMKLYTPDYIVHQNAGKHKGHDIAIVTIGKDKKLVAIDLGSWRTDKESINGESGFYNVVITEFDPKPGYIDKTIFHEKNDILYDSSVDKKYEAPSQHVAESERLSGLADDAPYVTSITDFSKKSNTDFEESDDFGFPEWLALDEENADEGEPQLSMRSTDSFTTKADIDAEIDRVQDLIRDIQNAKWNADEQAKKDPRVQAAQEKAWAAEDEKGWSGSLRERVEYKRVLKQVKEELAAEIPEGDLNELAQRVTDLKELREQYLKVTPITDADYDKLADHFGTTDDYEVAGFILKDGRMLDFSGKKQYGKAYAGGREIYHNEVGDVLNLPTDTSPRIDMVSNGNIRIVPEINGINLSQKPTSQQKAALRGFIEYHKGNVHIDVDNAAGRTIESFGYYSGTSAAKILADIDNYFRTGETPAPASDLRAFYSLRDSSAGDTREETAARVRSYNLSLIHI